MEQLMDLAFGGLFVVIIGVSGVILLLMAIASVQLIGDFFDELYK